MSHGNTSSGLFDYYTQADSEICLYDTTGNEDSPEDLDTVWAIDQVKYRSNGCSQLPRDACIDGGAYTVSRSKRDRGRSPLMILATIIDRFK